MLGQLIQTEQTRQQILAGGFQCLKEKGIKGLTAAQIAKAAGISKSGFFHHFPKIDDFFLYMLDQMIQMLDIQVQQANPKTMVELLKTSFDTTLKMLDEIPEFMVAIYYFIDYSRFNKTYNLRLQKFLKVSIEKWTNDFSNFFPPDFSEEKKATYVCLVDVFFSGLGTQYLILQDKELFIKISNEFINLITNNLEGSTK